MRNPSLAHDAHIREVWYNKICWSAIPWWFTKPAGHVHQEEHISLTYFPRVSILPTSPVSLDLYPYSIACKSHLFKTTSLFGITIEVLGIHFGLSIALIFYDCCLSAHHLMFPFVISHPCMCSSSNNNYSFILILTLREWDNSNGPTLIRH